jgi:hypothetical protein
MWTAYTEVDNELDVDDVLSAIKSGLVKVKAASARL